MLSAPTAVTPAVQAAIDPAAVKLFLRVDGDTLDEEIAGYIGAVIADIEAMTSTRLAQQTVEIRADRFADLGHLSIGPVRAISALSYQDSAGDLQLLPPTSYELFGAGLEQGIRPAFGYSWPATRGVSATIAARLDVGYEAGTLPAAIVLAVKLGVRSKFDGTPCDLFTATINDRIWL